MKIDPQWAWAAYQPDDAMPWTRARAAHLARRAGFAANWTWLDRAVQATPEELVGQFMDAGDENEAFTQEMDELARTLLASGDPRNLSAWWLYRMLRTHDPLHEKMTLFWHGHFATSAAKVDDARMMLDQNQLLRAEALGNFPEMVQRISKDPAMLVYLDSVTNRKAHPNENYSRELMELFCLGEGNYSEKDIQELARCFTGWEVKRDKYRFNRFQHDTGEKSILGASGEFAGEDGVRVVLDQPAAPRFIAWKLVKFFVFDEPDPSPELIEPLARQFRDEELRIAPLVKRILSSNLFFSEHAMGRKVRSPVELSVGLMRALEGSTNVTSLGQELEQLGQGLFYPPNVKGWDGGRTWINSSTLLGRANLVRDLVFGENTRFAGGTLAELVDRYGVSKPAELVSWLEQLLFAVPLPPDARERLEALARGGNEERIADVVYAMGAMPEFHLS